MTTLPYVAIACLLLVTAYSASVSFRKGPASATPSWIFPNAAKRWVRFVVILATLGLVVAPAIWFRMSIPDSTPHPLRFLIPEGYSGWVRVEFEVAGKPPLRAEAGQTTLKVASDGRLQTSSPEPHGVGKDGYFYDSAAGPHPLPGFGPGRMIWGKMRGEESGASGTRKYEDFFVGTEQQYRDHAADRKKSGP
jgi:hypothetical protein